MTTPPQRAFILIKSLGEPGHKGRVTRLLSSGWEMVQWLTGTAQERREHPANLLQLHDDFFSDQTMVAFDMAAPVSYW